MNLVETIEKALNDYDWKQGKGADSGKMAEFIAKRIAEHILQTAMERTDRLVFDPKRPK